jgi:hypothetical protein
MKGMKKMKRRMRKSLLDNNLCRRHSDGICFRSKNDGRHRGFIFPVHQCRAIDQLCTLSISSNVELPLTSPLLIYVPYSIFAVR